MYSKTLLRYEFILNDFKNEQTNPKGELTSIGAARQNWVTKITLNKINNMNK